MLENISRTSPFASVLLVWILLVPLGGREVVGQEGRASDPRYAVKDLGTFGGPNSFYFSAPVVQSMNNRGSVVGGAETPAIDPLAPNCFLFTSDCKIVHAFKWRDSRLSDLGTLPGGYNSVAYWVNEHGLILGNSENGLIDPLTGLAEEVAVLWKGRQIVNLGTLEGGVFSFPNAMNNRGRVVGVAQNTIPDPFSYLQLGTQSRAFLWDDGTMRDLGTFGGPDGWAASINERGQVAGWALMDSTPNPLTGLPTQHPFLWQDGTMLDLGTLGGTFAVVGALPPQSGAGASINNRGQVIGTSNLAGDLIHHPFRWSQADDMEDLGTLGGDNGEAWWINDAGEVVGRADVPGPQHYHHAFLWRNGVITDLGVPTGQTCSTAIDINAKGQIIIDTGICGVGGGPGVLWQDGVAYDLNNLIPSNSAFFIGDVNFINDRGEIAVTGVLPNGDQHDLLLLPCHEEGDDNIDCDDAGSTNGVSQSSRPVVPTLTRALEAASIRQMLGPLNSRIGRQNRFGVHLQK